MQFILLGREKCNAGIAIKMKQTTNIETTITVELNAQDILAYVTEKKLTPPDWDFYSVEVIGNGVSQGAKLMIKHTKFKK